MTRTYDAQVAVIGGGLVGSVIAHAVAASGTRVVLVDRSVPNREGSGTTAGNLHIQGVHGRPGQTTVMDARVMSPLQSVALEHWRRLQEAVAENFELTVKGGVTVAETPEQAERLHAKLLQDEAAGVPVQLLTGAEARAFEPELTDRLEAATYCPSDGYVNPLLVTPAVLRSAERLGATVLTGARVLGCEHRSGRWRVRCAGSEVRADVVVNAAGPWAGDVALLAGVALKLGVVTAQMHLTARQPPTLRSLIQHASEGLSMKQVVSGQLLVGGGWPGQPFQPDGRQEIRIDSLLDNLALASRILPRMREFNLLRTWAGPVSTTPDELPAVGRVTALDNYYLCTGTYSFTLAPLWGSVISDLIAGRPATVNLSGLSPDRLVDQTSSGSPRPASVL